MEQEKFVAIGFLTQANLQMLGPSLRKVIPISQDARFDELLKALDEAETSSSGD